MRTLQEKYNAINEGKFSKDQFLRDARMEQPTLVTQYNGYDDAVQILKNRGMIQEVKIEEAAPASMQAGFNMVNLEARKRKEIIRVANKLFPEFGGDLQNLRPLSSEQREMVYQNLDPANLREATQPKPTKKGLADYRYKPTNDMDKYPYEQILRGLRVELEGLNVLGTPTPEEYTKALAKVLKNLEKDSIFYTNQVAGIKANKKRTDVMVDATPKNEVDKENGLQKAALKEAIKGVIKNILSEGVNLGPEGPQMFEDEVYEMQSEKSDSDYKNELADYLDDNQIYGYTNRIHDIMTGPDESTAAQELEAYLEDNQIYGRTYLTGILDIYADYPYDDRYQAGIEGMDESISLKDIL